ncbi:hypothetical protein BG452_05780 [Streptomyces sp. CBMA123]|nr:hypothetical protein [Streptomyces sp. CBMA123]
MPRVAGATSWSCGSDAPQSLTVGSSPTRSVPGRSAENVLPVVFRRHPDQPCTGKHRNSVTAAMPPPCLRGHRGPLFSVSP